MKAASIEAHVLISSSLNVSLRGAGRRPVWMKLTAAFMTATCILTSLSRRTFSSLLNTASNVLRDTSRVIMLIPPGVTKSISYEPQ